MKPYYTENYSNPTKIMLVRFVNNENIKKWKYDIRLCRLCINHLSRSWTCKLRSMTLKYSFPVDIFSRKVS